MTVLCRDNPEASGHLSILSHLPLPRPFSFLLSVCFRPGRDASFHTSNNVLFSFSPLQQAYNAIAVSQQMRRMVLASKAATSEGGSSNSQVR